MMCNISSTLNPKQCTKAKCGVGERGMGGKMGGLKKVIGR
jgi:hypothetical protein